MSSPPFSSGSGWFPGQPWGCGCLALCAGRRADIVVNGRLRGPCVCQAELSIARCRAEVRNGRTWALNFSMPLALQRETLPVVLAARHRGFRRVLSVESALAGVVGLGTVTGEDGDTFQYEMMERSLVLTLTVPGGASYMLPTWTARFRTRANILLTSCLTAQAEQFSHPRQSQYAFRFVKSLRVHDVVGDQDLPGGSNRRPAWRGTSHDGIDILTRTKPTGRTRPWSLMSPRKRCKISAGCRPGDLMPPAEPIRQQHLGHGDSYPCPNLQFCCCPRLPSSAQVI